MVSVNPHPAQGFYFFDSVNRGLPGLNFAPPAMSSAPAATPTTTNNTSASTTTSGSGGGNTVVEDPSKKIRKPYTITKSRESWTEQEHDKFLEALQLFDRDWKKIEAFVGSKTVIQIRSHAQKYFLKVQKNGASEHVPPPRPKRKAAHPYPQKAPKIAAPVVSQMTGPLQNSNEQGYVYRPDSSAVLGNPIANGNFSTWNYDSDPAVNVSQASKDDAALTGQKIPYNCGYSSSNESTPRNWKTGEIIDQGDQGKPMRVMPDFAQVYSFIGSVFDPGASDHMRRLKQMDPIDLETAMLLMRNLSINLTSPEFENHRRLLASYDLNDEGEKSGGSYNHINVDTLGNAVPTV